MPLARRIGTFAALGLCACTLIYGPSDAEFSGGVRDAGASSSSSSSGSSEAGVVVATDAGNDAGADAGAFVCPPGALLCDDFESANNPFTTTSGAMATVSGGPSGSGNAIEATLTSSEHNYPYLESTLTPSVAAGTLSFWFKPSAAAPDPNDYFRVASAAWGGACDWQLSWTTSLSAQGLGFDISFYDAADKSCGPGGYDSRPLVGAEVVYDGNWHHVVVALDARTQNISAIVTFDAQSPVPLTLNNGRTKAPDTVALDFGVPCIQTNSGCFAWTGSTWKVDLDEIAFTPQSP